MRFELAKRYVHGVSTSLLKRVAGRDWEKRFRILNKIVFRYPVTASYIRANDSILVSELNGNSIEISRPERIHRFSKGVGHRLSALASEYMLAEIGLQPDDVVIDIGANIGEVSKFVCETFRAKAIGIEPDLKEFQCLLRNTSPERCLSLNLALWAESGEQEIFFKNDTSDTSLIEPRDFERKSTIPVFCLDDVMDRDDVSGFVGNAVVKLIKLEAEGAEPEILRGAMKTLTRTEYVSVDCGPERGINEETTLVEVVRLLYARGFTIIGYFAKRSILLFRNNQTSN